MPMPKVEPGLVPLEILILLCAKAGIGTPYAIMSRLGVGVGASSPVLKRLEEKGLLDSESAQRNSRKYSITEKGEALLRSTLYAGPGVYGGSLKLRPYQRLRRLIFFAWIKGDLDEARVEIDRAEANLMRWARRCDVEVEEYRRILPLSNYESSGAEQDDPSDYFPPVYKFIDAVADAAEARTHVQALGALRKLVDELPPPPRAFLQNLSGRTKVATVEGEPSSSVAFTPRRKKGAIHTKQLTKS